MAEGIELQRLRHLHGIKVEGSQVPPLIQRFVELDFPPLLLQWLSARNLAVPTPIQMQCLPALCGGRDVIGLAETGSGKTLAYILPLLYHLLIKGFWKDTRPLYSPTALVLVPTRELVLQIEEVLAALIDFPVPVSPDAPPQALQAPPAALPSQQRPDPARATQHRFTAGKKPKRRKHALNRPSHRRRKAKRRRLLRDQDPSSSELFDWKRLQGLSEEGIESLLKELDASDNDNTEAVTEATPTAEEGQALPSLLDASLEPRHEKGRKRQKVDAVRRQATPLPQPQQPQQHGPPEPLFPQAQGCGLIGGIPHAYQVKALSRHPQVVVATPGRLLDLLERRVLRLDRVGYVVIDEVDKLIEGGMEAQVRQILAVTPSVGVQVSLWSATMPHALERVARSAVKNPIVVNAYSKPLTQEEDSGEKEDEGEGGSLSGGVTGGSVEDIAEEFLAVEESKKLDTLVERLRRIPAPPVLIFCNTQQRSTHVFRKLQKLQFHVAVLHGGVHQSYRTAVFRALMSNQVDVLVATDIAARGLDVSSLNTVINYDQPPDTATYLHRIGRTGRHRAGVSITFTNH